MCSAASLFVTVQAMFPDERPSSTRTVMVGCLSPSLMLLRMGKCSCTCGPSISRPCRVQDPTSFSVLGTRATSLVDVCGLACTLRDRGPCLHGSCDVAPRVSKLFKKDCPRAGSNFSRESHIQCSHNYAERLSSRSIISTSRPTTMWLCFSSSWHLTPRLRPR